MKNMPRSINHLALVLALWVTAGMIWAFFAPFVGFAVEAGEDLFDALFRMALLGPLIAARAMAFCIIPGGYNEWPGRQTWEGITAASILGVFLIHAVLTVTRTTRSGFLKLIAVQCLMLIAAIAAVLYFCYWDSIHMHG